MNTEVSSQKNFSIVIPVYFNEGSLTETMNTIDNDVIRKNPELKCEIIFVDDGSGDGSLNELITLQKNFPDIIKIIKLWRSKSPNKQVNSDI